MSDLLYLAGGVVVFLVFAGYAVLLKRAWPCSWSCSTAAVPWLWPSTWSPPSCSPRNS